MINKTILETCIIILVSLLLVIWLSPQLPFNMDEFIQYDTLSSYYYPFQRLVANDIQYYNFDLAPISNYYLPLRSYEYIGSFLGLLYYPLFKLWPSPHSVRFWGLIMLAAQAFFIYKIFNVNMLVSFLFLLCCMPYVLQHIVDTGPVAFQTTSIFMICYLARHWIRSLERGAKYSWRDPIIIGGILFLGVWVKLTYFFILPGIILLIMYFIIRKINIFIRNQSINKLMRHAVLLVEMAAIPTLLLLNSIDRGGQRYYEIITSSPRIGPLDFKTLTERFHYDIGKLIFNPLMSAHRIFEVSGDKISLGGVLLVTVIIVVIFFGLERLYSKKSEFSFIIVNITSFVITIFLMTVSIRTWGAHHIVLGFPFLALALFHICAKLRKNKVVLILATTFIVANIILYFDLFKLPRLRHQVDDHSSKEALNELLNRQYADRYVFFVIEKGIYSFKALYGDKNQCVINMAPFRTLEQVRIAKAIMEKLERKALFIGTDKNYAFSDLILLRNYFPNIVQLKTSLNMGKWKVWYQP